jgi:hypothetical protein
VKRWIYVEWKKWIMKFKFNIKERWQRFKAWREQPSQLAPLSDESHECECCHTSFQGNYCPRCGQSWRIGRYSFKTATLGFLDVWGLGNRGMFRTIRDLILRPGYMIRDYLKGMQTAYFPPFKMFFVLAVFSILVMHGFNIKMETYAEDESMESVERSLKYKPDKDETIIDHTSLETDKTENSPFSVEQKDRVKDIYTDLLVYLVRFSVRFPSIFSLLVLMLFSGVLYLFFRHCPNIPDLRYSEFFVSLVYANNMCSIYCIILGFFCLTTLALLSILLVLIPLKQLSGYSWVRTILKTSVAFVLSLVLFLTIFFIVFFLIMGYVAVMY